VAIRQPTAARRIVRNPRVLGGEPIIRSTRISIPSIVLAARKWGIEGVLEAYPQVTPVDVHDALAFHDTHKAEIDRHIRANLTEG
jgi:uncharacterized protein (DUF433 family)